MSRYSAPLRYSPGIPVQTWLEHSFLSKEAKANGPDIPGIGSFNSALLVLHSRIELNDQTSRLYDQGSPTPSGKVYGFVNAEAEFVDIFKKDFSRKNRLRKVFCLPLIHSVEDCEELKPWIFDCAAGFVKGRMGNNVHSATHVATAYSSALSSICYQLAESIARDRQKKTDITATSNTMGAPFAVTALSAIEADLLTGNEADLLTGDSERHMLYDALEWISHTIRVLIEYSPEIEAIFQTLSMAYRTPDTLQSLNATYLLGTTVSDRDLGNWIYLSYMRYLRHSETASFTTNFPVGLTALMVVSPMIFHNRESDTSWCAKIEQIVDGLDAALIDVETKFESGEIATDYDLRVATLEAFCSISLLIDPNLIPKICEAVENGLSFNAVLRSPRPTWMIDATPMINGREIDNPAHITELDSAEGGVRVIGSDSSNWSAICLRPGVCARVKIFSLGCKTQMGNTAGRGRIQNVRFSSTFDPHFADIMKGQKGVSTSGQVYYPGMNRFSPHIQPNKIDISGEWRVESSLSGLRIECDDNVILADAQPFFAENYEGPEYTNSERFALISFKNCYLEIDA
jgi:hypothetical protein